MLFILLLCGWRVSDYFAYTCIQVLIIDVRYKITQETSIVLIEIYLI